ncbi:ATP-binding protein [Actinomadura graeca]|uniref:ATP-binding protein n=2 Tax=Actinomadura graeca TaxID=2750812 RepID=A0ABX8QV53_9ACTN|nr:ATP-binding protein [Actinomadura graeca]
MRTLIEVINQPGQHAIIYGERGVGKTSLARVMKMILETTAWTVDFTCSSTDTYATIWREILSGFPLSESQPKTGFQPTGRTQTFTKPLAALLGDTNPSPNQVRRLLEMVSEVDRTVILIDEFDRPEDARFQTLFADTIKILSDHGINVTLLLLGVGDTVGELIKEHASIQRAIVQVPMPRMGNDELEHIVRQGMKTASLSVEDDFVQRVVRLSQGLPHYTHLISQHAGLCAVDDARDVVTVADYESGVAAALKDVSQTVRERYHNSTYSKRETLHKQVLLACAVASKDELGTFGAADVREQLQEMTGIRYDISSFASHLNAFSSTEGQRGGILIKKGPPGRFRYRFIDPLLPPFVVMRGTVDGVVNANDQAAPL